MQRTFWYIAPHVTFSTAMAVFDMFVGFYLFRFGTGSFLAPLAFAVAGWLVVPLGQSIAASLSRFISLAACLRLGAIATGMAFASVALFAAANLPWWSLIPVALAYGLVRSLYWSARNQVDFHIVRERHSDRYFGYQAASSTAAATALGIISGIIVERYPSEGYVIVFVMGSCLFLSTVFLVRALPDINGSFSLQNFRSLSSLNPAFNRVFIASIFRGVSGYGTLPVAIQLFTFSALQRELPVAGFSGSGAVLALIVGSIVARIVRPRHRTGIAWGASAILLALGLALALMPTGFLGSMYLVLAPMATVLLVAPTLAVDNAIFSHDDSVVAEYIVGREIGMAIGRIASAVPLMFLLSGTEAIGTYLAFMSLAYPLQVMILVGKRGAVGAETPFRSP